MVADPARRRHPFDRTVEVGGPTGLFETANLFVTRAAFDRAGGFSDWAAAAIDEPFGEDAVFGWDARRAARGSASSRAHALPMRCSHADLRAMSPSAGGSRFFPALVARVPELRREFLVGRTFLTERTARFDFALAGIALAAVRRSPIPLAATVPYVGWLSQRALGHRRNAALVAATEVAADAVGFAALVAGSVRHRSPVL